jgi:hypothetical protein
MRYSLFLAVFCCFVQGPLAALQEPAEHGNRDILGMANPVGVASARNNEAPRPSLSTSFQWENGNFAHSFRYLKSRLFGATTVRTDDSASIDFSHQMSSARTRLSSLRRTTNDNVAPSSIVSARSLASGPMPVEMNQPTNVQPRVPIVPAPFPATRAEPTDSPAPVPENCLTKPAQLSCPPLSVCPGENAMFKKGRGTCESSCVPAKKCIVDAKKKQGWVCGWCSS